MAGLIPQDFIDDLVARADIVEVVGRRVQLKKAGREFKACCPFHDEKTPSFTVSPTKGFYHCFGCGAHGTAIGFLMEYDHMDFVEAIESLAATMGVDVPRNESDRPTRRYDELFSLLSTVEKDWQKSLRDAPQAVEYLQRRGIDGSTAQRFGIGYAPAGWSNLLDRHGKSDEAIDRLLAAGLVIRKDDGRHYDRFRDRLVFPIRDARGRCIGFGARTLGDEEPKYLNSPETVLFHKGRELYGLWEARQALRSIDRLIVVEGYMDVVGLARHGIDFAVATLGTATTAEHLNRLFRLTDDVAFCFDGDQAGRKAAWRALETALPHVRDGRQIRFVFLPDGQDPDSYVNEFGADAFLEAIASGLSISDFLIDELANQVDLSSIDGQARFVELARPMIAKISSGVYRDLLIEALANRVLLSTSQLRARLASDNAAAGRRDGARRTVPGSRLAPSSSKLSVVRHAIRLLVNHPTAGRDLDPGKLAGVDRPGIDLLRSLVETVKRQPNITTAGLVERWRNDDQGRHLGRLAADDIFGEDFDAGAELGECFDKIESIGRRERFRKAYENQSDTELRDFLVEQFRSSAAGDANTAFPLAQ